jgi:hypothetical protein
VLGRLLPGEAGEAAPARWVYGERIPEGAAGSKRKVADGRGIVIV